LLGNALSQPKAHPPSYKTRPLWSLALLLLLYVIQNASLFSNHALSSAHLRERLRELAVAGSGWSDMATIQIECKGAEGSEKTISEHSIGVAFAICAVLLADQALKQCASTLKANNGARWFALHSLANLAISFTCLPDLLAVSRSPLCAMLESMASWAPSYLSFGLHVYHFLAFTKLRAEDIWHHLLFVGTFGAVNFAMEWGRSVNCILFFITGVPGFLDYGLLALVKTGSYGRLAEKKANASINVWLRCPGLFGVAVMMSMCAAHGALRVPYIAAAVVIVLVAGNGIYYMAQVHQNYHEEAARSAALAKGEGERGK
jgi:hypothetical protein